MSKGVVSVSRSRAAKILDDIMAQIAKEEGISIKKVNCVLQSVFGLIAEDMRSGSLKGSHIIHLGKFKVKQYNMVRYYKKHDGKLIIINDSPWVTDQHIINVLEKEGYVCNEV